MNPNGSVYCFSLLLLLNFMGVNPDSDFQNLLRVLEEEIDTAPVYGPEEMEVEGKALNTDQQVLGAPEWMPSTSSDLRNSPLTVKEDTLGRLFKDLLRTSKRSWSRSRKGGLRSCFGVRLERIGSFSGLGC